MSVLEYVNDVRHKYQGSTKMLQLGDAEWIKIRDTILKIGIY